MKATNPCCQVKKPFFQGNVDKLIDVTKNVKRKVAGFTVPLAYYNNFPKSATLSSNTDFDNEDVEKLKNLYDLIEGFAFEFIPDTPSEIISDFVAGLGKIKNLDADFTAGDLSNALKDGLQEKTRCYLCKRLPMFKLNTFDFDPFSKDTSDNEVIQISFVDFVERYVTNKNNFLSLFYSNYLKCTDFGFDNNSGGTALSSDNATLIKKANEGKCTIEEETELPKRVQALPFENLCDIILAETIKSYLL